MADQEKILDHLQGVFRDMESRLNGSYGNPLHAFQKKSFEALKQVQFPDRKHEDWKYTSVQKLVSHPYLLAANAAGQDIMAIPGLESYVIPVMNGQIVFEDIDPALHATGITITSLKDAFEHTSWHEVFHHWISDQDFSTNQAFELLNFSFHANAFFLEVPKNVLLDKPIEMRIIHDDPTISFSNPLFFIRCRSGSSITLFERFEKNNLPESITSIGLINSLGYIHLDKNASLKHIKWQHLPAAQNLVYKLIVAQQKDSRFETLAFDFGGAIIRNNIEVELEEPNTYTSIQAGFLAKDQQSMDHQTRINHKVANGESHERYKGIIDGQASAAFNGKVYVHPDAQKTNAYQQNDTLVLSPHALMNSKPQLEIYADDVKCSHGATIGQLDEKALFYLKSRGIDTSSAKHILKSAFLAPVFDMIPNDPIRIYISTRMSMDV